MGTAGAAAATVIGQCISLTAGLTDHIRLNKEVDNGFRYLKPNGRILKNIYRIGIPAIIMQTLVSFMNYGMNTILAGVSDSMVFGAIYPGAASAGGDLYEGRHHGLVYISGV